MTAENAFLCSTPSCQGAGGTGNVTTGLSGTYVVDEQDFSLGSTFAGQTLTSIVITDTYGGSTPLLLGATIASGGATSTATPEPSSVVLLAMGVLAAGVARKRLAS